jgi:hypothetical protein
VLSYRRGGILTNWKNTPKNIEKYQGFVYKITNKTNNKYYIGKSNFWYIEKKPPLKGRKNKRHVKKETKWRDYWGSSESLRKDIEELGVENFRREILWLCQNKWEMSYFETKEQIDRNVLFDDYSYNGIINCRIPKAPKETIEKFNCIL